MALSNVPIPHQSLLNSRDLIAANFADINTGFSVNHGEFRSGAATGKHTYLQIPLHASPITAVGEVGLYAANGGTSHVAELFFKRENTPAGAAGIAFTESSVLAAVNFTAGWCNLPCGLIMQWGHGVSGTPQNFSKPFTFVYSATATMNAHGEKQFSGITSFDMNQITFETYDANQHVSAGKRFYFIAIGI
jgi:hypothetical protein